MASFAPIIASIHLNIVVVSRFIYIVLFLPPQDPIESGDPASKTRASRKMRKGWPQPIKFGRNLRRYGIYVVSCYSTPCTCIHECVFCIVWLRLLTCVHSWIRLVDPGSSPLPRGWLEVGVRVYPQVHQVHSMNVVI